MKIKKVHIRTINNRLFLDYFFNGQRIREALNLADEPNNLEIATRLAKEKEISINNIQNALIQWNMPKSKMSDDKVQSKLRVEIAKKKLRFNISDGLTLFLKDNPKNKKNEAAYKSAVKSFIDFGGKDANIKDVDSKIYQDYKNYLLSKKSYSTARTYINYIRMLFDYFKKIGKYLEDNPFLKLKERKKQNIRTIPDNHWNIILPYLQNNNPKVYDYIYFLKYTGFRRDEALKLKWSDVKFDDNVIIVTTYKDNERQDLFPLNLNGGQLKLHLKDMIDRRTPNDIKLFNMTEEYPRKILQKSIKKLNEDFKKKEKEIEIVIPKYTLHDIRRTFGSYWATKITPIQLQKLMRHQNIETTLKYYVSIDILSIADSVK